MKSNHKTIFFNGSTKYNSTQIETLPWDVKFLGELYDSAETRKRLKSGGSLVLYCAFRYSSTMFVSFLLGNFTLTSVSLA